MHLLFTNLEVFYGIFRGFSIRLLVLHRGQKGNICTGGLWSDLLYSTVRRIVYYHPHTHPIRPYTQTYVCFVSLLVNFDSFFFCFTVLLHKNRTGTVGYVSTKNRPRSSSKLSPMFESNGLSEIIQFSVLKLVSPLPWFFCLFRSMIENREHSIILSFRLVRGSRNLHSVSETSVNHSERCYLII
jgi:hypothetical protein